MSKRGLTTTIAFWLVVAIVFAKIIVTGSNRLAIVDAIYVYQLDCRRTDRDAEVWQEDKESYEDTYRRWWDWSDHHILPEDKYRLVRPYLGEDVEAWERMVDDG